MKTVKDIIEYLKIFPEDAIVFAYEGETTCIVVRSSDNKRELGYIDCAEPYTRADLDNITTVKTKKE